VERSRRGLEAEPGDDHRETEEQESVVLPSGRGDAREVDRTGRAVDESAAEQQYG